MTCRYWLLPLLFMHCAGAALATVDVRVTGVEVTQGIQNGSNGTTLVAGRATAVRVTASVTGLPTGTPTPAVEGRLHLLAGGVRLTPPEGLPPLNELLTPPVSFIPPGTADRGREQDTLNFEVPASITLPAMSSVQFQVLLTPLEGELEADRADNEWKGTFSLRASTAPVFHFVPIDYLPGGTGLPLWDRIRPGVGDAFLRGILPLEDLQLKTLYRPSLGLPLVFGRDDNANQRIDGDESNFLLSRLATYRHLLVTNNLGGHDQSFLYGWLNGNPTGSESDDPDNGLATTPGRVAFGNTAEERYQRTFAHEVMHNLGFEDKTSERIEEVGWDVGARLVNNPPANGVSGRVKAPTLFDLMVPGKLTNEAWIRQSDYVDILDDPQICALPSSCTECVPYPGAMVIHGIYDPTGMQIIDLKPVFRYPWLTQATFARNGVEFFPHQIRLVHRVGNDEQVTRLVFRARVTADRAGEQRRYGFFEAIVPCDIPVDEIHIPNIQGGIAKRLTRSALRPSLDLIGLRSGTLPETTTVRWVVVDADTPASEQMIQIAYSPDDGQSWVPLAVDLPGGTTEFRFTTALLPPSQNARIRVIVSDGLNTTYHDAAGLRTP